MSKKLTTSKPGKEQFSAQLFEADDAGEGDDSSLKRKLVWYSGEQVRRYDYRKGGEFIMTLSMKDGAADLSRLNSGAPLLDTHAQNWGEDDLRSGVVLGKIEEGSAKADGKANSAVAVLSQRDDEKMRGIRQDVKDGIIKNVSVGFVIKEMKDLSKRNKETGEAIGMQHWEVTQYQPDEVSLVPIGAAQNAHIMSAAIEFAEQHYGVGDGLDLNKESIMDRKTSKGSETEELAQGEHDEGQEIKTVTIDASAEQLAKARKEAAGEERERMAEIRERGVAAGIKTELVEEVINEGLSVTDSIVKLFDHVAKEDQNVNRLAQSEQRVQVNRDERDTVREGISDALLCKIRPRDELSENGQRFANWTLHDVLRHYRRQEGGNTEGWGANEMVRFATHISADFPNVISNVANRGVHRSYMEYDRSYTPWTTPGTANNFLSKEIAQLSEHPNLRRVAEGGEIQRVTLGDAKETYALSTYAEIFSLSRQAIINDDLSLFARVTREQGVAAARTEGNLVYGQLITNAGAPYDQADADGPVMGDGASLFDSTHSNDVTVVDPLDPDAINNMRVLMRTQTGLSGISNVQITPKYLLVPPSLEMAGQQALSTTLYAPAVSDINPFPGTLQLIVEPRLADDTVGTAKGNRYYLIADPSEVETMTVATLQGNSGPYMEQDTGFEVDEVRWKVRIDFAAKWIDWRGIVRGKNAT